MNKLFEAKRLSKILRYSAFSALILLTTSFIAYFSFTEFLRYSMNALNHEKLTPVAFDKLLAEYLSQPEYLANKEEATLPVEFHFNLQQFLMQDIIFVIQSSKTSQLIFRAPYQPIIRVYAEKKLLANEGYDDFKFILFNKKTHEVSVAEHDTGFWKSNKNVYIDFLPEREIDKDSGVPVAFKVRVE